MLVDGLLAALRLGKFMDIDVCMSSFIYLFTKGWDAQFQEQARGFEDLYDFFVSAVVQLTDMS